MDLTLFVHNIKCGGCANSIKTSLNKIDHVNVSEVDVENGKIVMEVADENTASTVRTKLEKMGYPEGDPSVLQTAKSFVSCMIGRTMEKAD